MRERQIVEYRGFSLSHLFMAALTGAAAGAAVAYLTAPASGADSRQRVREALDGTTNGVSRVPLALKRATEAARDAFAEALEAENGRG